MSKSENLYHTARELIPGGVNSPVRAFTGVGGTPLFIERADGAYLYDGTRGTHYPALKIKAVDSTAAGDTFNAAVCFRLCQGADMAQSIAFANAAAAITVSRRGALSAIPTESEVAQFLSDGKKEGTSDEL